MPVTVRVRDALENNVFFVDASKTVHELVEAMVEKGVWSFVVTRSEMPVGVVTERDVIRRCIAKGMDLKGAKVESIMSSPLITITPDAPLGEAMGLMAEKNVRRVYVVEKGKIVGRLTQTGVFAQMLNIMMALSAVI
jgi:signal-transduction protein with cAMP-binding, CBS, and nucleotidyltransferase domain